MNYKHCCIVVIAFFLSTFFVSYQEAQAATFVVNTSDDAEDHEVCDEGGDCTEVGCDEEHCSLREAILAANANGGLDNIAFQGSLTISVVIDDERTQSPEEGLPFITSPVIIDGTGKTVVIDGSNAGEAHGLVIIAGSSTVEGLVINNFDFNGIFLFSGDGNKIFGNFIGTDPTGTVGMGNGANGIQIQSSSGNIIGGITAVDRNVISWNDFSGIQIIGGSNNIIRGNYIGTDASGKNNLGNTGDGISIFQSTDNTIGGTVPGDKNIISGNDHFGVEIIGEESTNNKIQGNYIGTDVDGKLKIPNFEGGINVQDGVDNTIGGTTSAARNIISGNDGNGVQILGLVATLNKIQGNYIGVNVDGNAALGNSFNGIIIDESSLNTIGGIDPSMRNVISGNEGAGILITDPSASGNIIQGNYIGTDSSGTKDLGNFFDGIQIVNAPNTLVGDKSTPAGGNIISGNEDRGIIIFGSDSTGNKIYNNKIGTDVSGNIPLGNSNSGVSIIDAPNNEVGANPAGNIISANEGHGVQIIGSTATNNKIIGNMIGTDSTGMLDFGNLLEGVQIQDAPSNFVGGTTADERNIISGNDRSGILISGTDAKNNIVQGNYIGTNVNGNPTLGNTIDGVQIIDGSSNEIGTSTGLTQGSCTGGCNLIAGNVESGVGVVGLSAIENSIRYNSIFENGQLGIDLGKDGVTQNDLGNEMEEPDSDSGPNNLMNFPQVSAKFDGTNTVISGKIQTNLSVEMPEVDIYLNEEGDMTGFGEGQVFFDTIKFTNIQPDGSFSLIVPGKLSPPFVSASASNTKSSTSEFGPIDIKKIWIGGVGNWNVDENWFPEGVPIGSDNIIIDFDPTTVSIVTLDIDFILTTGSIAIDSGDKLIIGEGKTLQNDSEESIINFGTMIIDGSFINNGFFSNGGIVQNKNSFVHNQGTLENTCLINNAGPMEGNGGIFLILDNVNNDGAIANNCGGSTIDILGQISGNSDFNIQCPEIPVKEDAISGRVVVNTPDRGNLPLKAMTMELLSTSGNVATTTDSSDGNFLLDVPDGAGSISLDVLLSDAPSQVFPNGQFTVEYNTFGSGAADFQTQSFDPCIGIAYLELKSTTPQYALSGKNEAPSSTNIVPFNNFAHLGAIFYYISIAFDFANTNLPGIILDDGPLSVVGFSTIGNMGPVSFFTSPEFGSPGTAIHIESTMSGESDMADGTNIESDIDPVFHEFGHYLTHEAMMGGENSLPERNRNIHPTLQGTLGATSSCHRGYAQVTSSCAWTEGVATFLGAVIQDTMLTDNAHQNLMSNMYHFPTSAVSLESSFTNIVGPRVAGAIPFVYSAGWEEFAVASLLWDIYDNTPLETQGGVLIDPLNIPIQTLWPRLNNPALNPSNPAEIIADINDLFTVLQNSGLLTNSQLNQLFGRFDICIDGGDANTVCNAGEVFGRTGWTARMTLQLGSLNFGYPILGGSFRDRPVAYLPTLVGFEILDVNGNEINDLQVFVEVFQDDGNSYSYNTQWMEGSNLVNLDMPHPSKTHLTFLKDGFSSQTVIVDSLDFLNGFGDPNEPNALSFTVVLVPEGVELFCQDSPCEDNNECTIDSCDEDANSCSNVIDDGAACGIAGICDVGGMCIEPPPEPGANDHYLGYKVKETKHTEKFEKITVTLSDQFETDAIYTVEKPERLFNPVNKNKEGITDEITHLLGYKIKAPKGEKFETVTNIQVTNQFGDLIIDVKKPKLLLVPSSKDLTATPDELDSITINHYKCYDAKETKGTPKFVKRQVTLSDPNFGETKIFEVKKPKQLCVPVEKNDEGIIDPENILMCYDLKKIKDEPKFEKRNVFTNNQFEPEDLEVKKEHQLCVPSTKTLP